MKGLDEYDWTSILNCNFSSMLSCTYVYVCVFRSRVNRRDKVAASSEFRMYLQLEF